MSNKKTIVWVVFIIIILLIIGCFYFFKNSKEEVINTNKDVKTNDIKSSVISEVEKTNPFKADINPYNGYKNPFE